MKITKVVKVRVVQQPDGRFAVEYKGLFFWRSCYWRSREHNWLVRRERKAGDFAERYNEDECYKAIGDKDLYLGELRWQRGKEKKGPVIVREYFEYKD